MNIKTIRRERERSAAKQRRLQTATGVIQRCPRTGATVLVKIAWTGQVMHPGDSHYDDYVHVEMER